MMAADLVRAAVQALIAVAFFTDSVAVWQLAVASILFGAASAFFNPASTGLLPQIVSTGRLQVSLVGMPLAMFAVGPLSAQIGVGKTLLVSAVVVALSLVGALASRDVRDLQRLDAGPRPSGATV